MLRAGLIPLPIAAWVAALQAGRATAAVLGRQTALARTRISPLGVGALMVTGTELSLERETMA